MTNNADIDLSTIPNPEGFYPVPVGATIPARTPLWAVRENGSAEWESKGYFSKRVVTESDALYLTREPITAPPAPLLTPEDSPIIIGNVEGYKPGMLATWHKGVGKWYTSGNDGHIHWVKSEDISDWSPAIVTKSGHGIWDERDKRTRVNKYRERVEWLPISDKWLIHATNERSFGSLAAVRCIYGKHYLTGFWGEEGGEK